MRPLKPVESLKDTLCYNVTYLTKFQIYAEEYR